jgi:transcriptional regulator with XRE-family HTH domain
MCIPSMGLGKIRTYIHALHFCDVTLTTKKPIPEAYPKTLQTIGDHLRKRRLDLKLYQKDIAKLIGVTTDTITNWEKNRVGPTLKFIPKVIDFLGYDPLPDSAPTTGQQIKLYRRKHGLSIKILAKILNIDQTTLARWEKGESKPMEKLKKRVVDNGLLFDLLNNH